MHRVLVAGPASWNTLVHVDDLPEPRPHTVFARRHHETVGGTSAGKAMNLSRLGHDVTLRTVLGTDEHAPKVRAALEAEGVHVLAEEAPDGRTERHLNLMDARGGRVSVYLQAPGEVPASGPAWDATLEALDAGDAVVVDLGLPSLPVLRAATARGRDVWVDLHDYDGATAFHRPWVDAGTHVFLSSDRMPGWREFMAARAEAGARLVVCTHGADGATALTPADGFVEVPAEPVVDVVDTNGAGDGFFAGFLDAHLRGASLADAMRAGAHHAAQVVRSPDLVPLR
ncbi:carbohydrate kinase family protein [Isoptericola variabilis]|uniref:PfkB domain protein n=1 Tax=Isoptericola variabilis (strain 225) TaxID=743718 RepID=F6FST4_ISOV2|nr:carbohydrate kinase family protein [Isoptericola variabilis]AEG43075.1 PfkB domain protein [Isoptericola variabilis 225]TWH35002.1 sugar/nucleoside kinase (ribokinase family) [Isoptericola variabilis J7]